MAVNNDTTFTTITNWMLGCRGNEIGQNAGGKLASANSQLTADLCVPVWYSKSVVCCQYCHSRM